MKHDIKYRRVLRTKEQYLSKYTTAGVFIFLTYIVRSIYVEQKGLKESQTLSYNLKKISSDEIEDDPLRVNEKWYYTLFDRRLWSLFIDLSNISKIKFGKEIIDNLKDGEK